MRHNALTRQGHLDAIGDPPVPGLCGAGHHQYKYFGSRSDLSPITSEANSIFISSQVRR